MRNQNSELAELYAKYTVFMKREGHLMTGVFVKDERGFSRIDKDKLSQLFQDKIGCADTEKVMEAVKYGQRIEMETRFPNKVFKNVYDGSGCNSTTAVRQ